MKGLTKRQAEVRAFIAEYTRQHGIAPGIRDIVARFGFRSTNAASDYLRRLAKKGYVRWEPRKSRTVVLTTPRAKEVGVSANGYAFEFVPPTRDDFGDVLFV